MLRTVVLTQYRRVTDGQTDGIAVASTALAKRRAVIKTIELKLAKTNTKIILITKVLLYRPTTQKRSKELERVSPRS